MKLVQVLLVAFVMVEFLPHGEQQFVADLFFLVIFTLHGVLIDYAHGNPVSWQTANRWSTMCGFWLLFICGAVMDTSFVAPVRPCLLISKSQHIRLMLRLMWKCVHNVRHIVALFLCVLAVTAIMTSLLEFEATPGQKEHNFLDSYIAMFIFVVSLENYDLVYQGSDEARLSWVYFMPIALIGVFLLSSMVIARFELTYEKYKHILSEYDIAQRKFGLGVAFALSTESELDADAFVNLLARYWDSRGVQLHSIQDRMAERDDARDSHQTHRSPTLNRMCSSSLSSSLEVRSPLCSMICL